tara:strand:- start:12 stop:461 length:450 start_codon:yes stop_codon:yes gene_type:complete
MFNFKIKYAYYFLFTIIFCNFFSKIISNEINHYSFDFVSFPEKSLNYKFNCGPKKFECIISIKKDYLNINKTKIKKDQIKNINSQLMCKSEFGISKCLPGNMKNIVLKKITLIYSQKDLLKAKLIFIKDLSSAKDFNKNIEEWLGWSPV